MLPFIDKILLYAVAQRASRRRYRPEQTPEGSVFVRVEGQLSPSEVRVQTHNHIETVQKPKVNHVCRQKMIGWNKVLTIKKNFLFNFMFGKTDYWEIIVLILLTDGTCYWCYSKAQHEWRKKCIKLHIPTVIKLSNMKTCVLFVH